MKTETLLNIRPEAQKGTESRVNHALTEDSATAKETDSFKSALMQQVGQHTDESFDVTQGTEKTLPQDGNELPAKEVAADQDITLHELNNTHELTKTNEVVNTHELIKADKVTNADESTNPHEINNTTGLTADPEFSQIPILTDNNSARTNIFEAENNKQQALVNKEVINEDLLNEQKVNEQKVNKEIVNKEKIAESVKQSLDEADTTRNKIVQPNLLAQPAHQTVSSDAIDSTHKTINNLRVKKNILSETPVNQLNSSSSIISTKLPQDIALHAGADRKNDPALGKHITNFQQYIELSQKHVHAEDPILSVKNFDEKLKAGQDTIQTLRNDFKTAAMLQTPNSSAAATQTAAQTAAVERSSFIPLSNLQNLASLEVKTTLGKAGWNQGFSSQISMMASNGIQYAKIKLNPAHMGPVEATVKLTGETAVVNISSLHLTTRDAMENAIPRLKEMLNENGFSQVDVNVSHQDKKQQQEAGLGSNSGSNNEHGNSTMPGDEQLSEEIPASEPNITGSQKQDLNIVDYYA